MTRRTYPRERVEDVLARLSVASAHRIFPVEYFDSPLGVRPGRSRFATADGGFAVLYAGSDFTTAFIEVVVRDRFVGRGKRELLYKELGRLAIVALKTRPNSELVLLDLREDGCVRLGAPTDVTGARNHAAGRALGRAIYREHSDIDGFVFESRLTGADAYVVFDRAIGKLDAGPTIRLVAHEELSRVLERYNLSLIRLTN